MNSIQREADGPHQIFGRHPVEILVGKIEPGFQFGEHMNQRRSAFPHLIAETTRHLALRQSARRFRLSRNQIRNRFRLRQVHFSVQEGSFCEFSRFSLARSRTEGGTQKAGGSERSSMTVNFRHILPRVTSGTGHIYGQAVLSVRSLCFPPLIGKFSQQHFSGECGKFSFPFPDPRRHRQRFRA